MMVNDDRGYLTSLGVQGLKQILCYFNCAMWNNIYVCNVVVMSVWYLAANRKTL